MKDNTLTALADGWEELAYTVLSLEELPLPQLQALLKETYRVLTVYCTGEHLPKELCRVLLGIEEYLCLASLMEDKEMGSDYYHSLEIQWIFDAFKEGLFTGHYPQAYPSLLVTDPLGYTYLFDLEKDAVENYFACVQAAKSEQA